MDEEKRASEEETEEETEAEEERREEESAARLENVIRSGAVITKRGRRRIHTVSIIGQVEGHYVLGDGQKSTKYEHLIPMLVAAENSDAIDGLCILLNTMGGDVEAGLAIAELIAGMKTPTVSLVLGGVHSIGVPLAVAAQKSMIAPSAAMTIHPVRFNGVVIGVPQTYDYFRRIQERIVRFVTTHSAIGEREYLRLMNNTDELANDVGSIIYGEEAVEKGLIDQVGTLADALDYLHGRIGQA